jgi:hypothetical protein
MHQARLRLLVVARVAEVRGAEAKEDGDGAAEAALVLDEVGAVLGAVPSARGGNTEPLQTYTSVPLGSRGSTLWHPAVAAGGISAEAVAV